MPKILLVEDNEINRDMLSRRLARKGYTVIMAIDGEDAITKTQSEQPDLVLMDLHLPVLDGWEATRQIKANPQTCAIPIIALTADALVGEREKAIAAGCDDYDTKPIDLSRLIATMTRLLKPAEALPNTAQPLEVPNQPQRDRLQRILRTRLRRQELDPPIYRIISYSDLLLNFLEREQPLSEQEALRSDLQKLLMSGMKLLRLTHAVLNPAMVEIQQQEIDLLGAALRRELLTPLSTIIGYCEMLIEEASADFRPDLEQIYASAQDLLGKVNGLDNLVKQITESIQALNANQQNEVDPALDYSISKSFWQQTALANDSSAHLPLKGSRILVVDSHLDNGTLISRHLAHQQSQVTTVATRQQALQALETLPYDLVLLEVNLPEGQETLTQIRSHPDWRNIPIVITAAPDEQTAINQHIAMGAVDYLLRPYQSTLLYAKIAHCIGHKQPKSQPSSFKNILENLPIGAYQATADGCFTCVNSSLAQLLGYSTAATLVTTVTDIASQIYVDLAQYAEFKYLLENHDRVTGFEYQAYRHDGDIIWVAEHAQAVRDNEGRLIHYEGIIEEITPRKLAEADLMQQLTTLQNELNYIKQAQRATEIIQTDYFQQLKTKAEIADSQDTPQQNPSPAKVLLVEDNELNADMLSRRLKRAGYEVVIASDGAEGVTKALSEQPSVILMDISLPVMDGWEATQQLKADAQTCQIPVIALTAHAMAGDREKAMAAGCDDYDTKPIDLTRLLKKIDQCLHHSVM